MSRKQSIKSLLGSSENKPGTNSHGKSADPYPAEMADQVPHRPGSHMVITAVVVGVVMGSAAIAGTTYAYTSGYQRGVEVATLYQVTKSVNQVNYTPPGLPGELLQLPPSFEEATAQPPAYRPYY